MHRLIGWWPWAIRPPPRAKRRCHLHPQWHWRRDHQTVKHRKTLSEKEISTMKLRVVVLGAGFGGLELSTILSEALADRLDLVLIDKNDSFFFGFSKLDV